MCTLTVVPVVDVAAVGEQGARGRRFRVAFNRDELRSRPSALPPRIVPTPSGAAIMPIDSLGGGTWITASDTGIVLALLNVNATPVACQPPGLTAIRRSSRGLIIPQLLRADDVEGMIRAACELDPRAYPAFRLVIVDTHEIYEIRSDGRSISALCLPLDSRPAFFTSSGLGDALVEGPRRALFDSSFTNSSCWLDEQRRFHRHIWPDLRHLSVCMSREDALTVSHTVVDVDDRTLTMRYHDGPPDAGGREFVIELPRREHSRR